MRLLDRYVIACATGALLACAPSGSPQPEDLNQVLAEQRAHRVQMEAMHRETLALVEGSSIEPFFLILAREALVEGKTPCALCLIEAEIDIELEKAERFLSKDPPDSVLESYIDTIDFLRSYREDHPWDESACTGICAREPGSLSSDESFR
ncbi:MAG: hypothetical protein ACQGVC_05860 [Myxococcota bacterium]